MLWPEQRCILRSSKPLVRLSQKDFLFPETRTLMAPPEKPICPFPSPVQKGKERFTWQQGSPLVSGTIPVSSSRSQIRINGSIFFNGRRPRIRPNHSHEPENPGVRAGYVELYFRTSHRLFVL